MVFAAASLKNALDAIDADWQKASGKHATISYAASSALAKQIENGAPADIFISADLDWMDYLDEAQADRARTAGTICSATSLVLIAPADSRRRRSTIGADFPLAKLLGGGKLAMADPASVPAGKYGKAALTKLGVWDSVAGRSRAAENVRAALVLVARGEAPSASSTRPTRRSTKRQDRRRLPGRQRAADHLSDRPRPPRREPRRQGVRRLSARRRGGRRSRRPGSPVTGCMSALCWLTPEELTAIRLSLWVGVRGRCGQPAGRPRRRRCCSARGRFWGKSLLNAFVHLPLVMPPVVTGYVLLLLFGRRGPLGRFFAEGSGSSSPSAGPARRSPAR